MATKSTLQETRDDQNLLQIGNKETIKLNASKSIEAQINNLNFDTQVKAKNRTPKRKFSHAYKLQILNALDACKNGNERAALLRREGLYYARISLWKKQIQHGQFSSNKTPKSILSAQQLTREVASLKKKLSQAEAIIDLQKKISELLSINILDHDKSEIS
jgi:transposase